MLHHRFSLVNSNLAAVLVVLLAFFSAVQQVPAAAVADAGQQRNLAPTATVTVLSTSLLPGATTSTVLTQSACGIIDGGGAITTCRRKRQYWIDVPILIAHDPETAAYLYQQFQPSPVYAVEPTQVVQFRNGFEQQQPASAFVDSSLDEVSTYSRANGALVAPINTIRTSLLAIATSVINSFLTPVSTATSVVTGYSTTVTSTIYTTTNTYTLAGCIPEGVSFTAC